MRWQLGDSPNSDWQTDENIRCNKCGEELKEENDKIEEVIYTDGSVKYFCYLICNPSSEKFTNPEVSKTTVIEYAGDVITYEVSDNGVMGEKIKRRKGFCKCSLDKRVIYEYDSGFQFCQRCYRMILLPIDYKEDEKEEFKFYTIGEVIDEIIDDMKKAIKVKLKRTLKNSKN